MTQHFVLLPSSLHHTAQALHPRPAPHNIHEGYGAYPTHGALSAHRNYVNSFISPLFHSLLIRLCHQFTPSPQPHPHTYLGYYGPPHAMYYPHAAPLGPREGSAQPGPSAYGGYPVHGALSISSVTSSLHL